MKTVLLALLFGLFAAAYSFFIPLPPPMPSFTKSRQTVDAGNFDANINNQDAQTGIITQTNNGDDNGNIFEVHNNGTGKENGSVQFTAGNMDDTEMNDAGIIEESQTTDNDKNHNRVIDSFGNSQVSSNAAQSRYGNDNVDNMDATAKNTKGKNKITQRQDNNFGKNYFGNN